MLRIAHHGAIEFLGAPVGNCGQVVVCFADIEYYYVFNFYLCLFMPTESYTEEVVMLAIVGIIVFLVVISLMVFIILFYQKKRFQHRQQMKDKEKEFSEQLLRTQLEIQEHTFNTISTEIHDNVGQTLSLAKVQLNIIDQSNVLNKTLLTDARESVSKAMTDLRDIAKSLNSERIGLSDLYEITEHELQRISRAGLMTTTIKSQGDKKYIQEQKKLIIFRMIQEALQNIIKHSGATETEVCFIYEPKQLKITVTDNGDGFDTGILQHKDGLGLHNIFSRAALIDGNASVSSTPGKGTVINITSPYE
jgi:signal transduction histidine kinase